MSDSKRVWTPDPSVIRKAGDPLQEPSPEELEEMEALAMEHQEMRDARLAVLDAWNWLENSLVELLTTVVGTPDPIVASALYFTPHSFRTRLDMIGRIVDHIVVNSMLDPALKKEWGAISEKLGKKRGIRNLAAHGHIITYADGHKPKNKALLAPMMNEMDRYTDAYRARKRPGATLSEVLDAIKVANELRSRVEAYHASLQTALRLHPQS